MNEIKQPSLVDNEQLRPVPLEENQTSTSQDTYGQILERLGIELPAGANDINDISQNPAELDSQSIQEISQKEDPINSQPQAKVFDEIMQQQVSQDLMKIDNLVRLGLANPLQAQNLKQQVLKNAFDNLVQQKAVGEQLQPSVAKAKPAQVLCEFERDNSDFFSQRQELFDYLQSESVIVDKDELSKISKMVETVEKNAIDKYLKKATYEKNLLSKNELAKQKLTANAQNSQSSDKNFGRIFTREQIGKLSSAEFAKYESLIMAQLKQGLIR